MNSINAICSLIKQRKPEITNLMLQKLLYFIQAYSLVTTGRNAFDSKIEAWTYGPVIPEVYYKFKNNVNCYDNTEYKTLDEETKKIVEIVLKNLGNINPFTLVKKTHTYDTWINAWNNETNKEITSKNILEYHLTRFHEKKGVF